MKRLVCMLAILLISLTVLVSCDPKENDDKKYKGPYSEINGVYGGVDSLNRTLDINGKELREDRVVGIFYFLWQGQHGTAGPYDNSKIVAKDPEAITSENAWMRAGGGTVGAHHFWGEPLFGYYTSNDKWVMYKHVQMLTDAGVDFLIFDTTNSYIYEKQVLNLLEILDKYYQKGWKVPKISFYTYHSAGYTLNLLYEKIYVAHPEYQHLWYYMDGKPMAVSVPSDPALKDEVKEFFRIKHAQWPGEKTEDGEFLHHEDALPWMDFEDKQWIFRDANGVADVVSVSMAQHSGGVWSNTAWYNNPKGKTRIYHDGENDKSENAILYGYNFTEQWEHAIEADPKMIFITGWNEWVAQRQQVKNKDKPIVFVDCADINTSRDAEPMEGGYGDNYYMQMMYYIRLYKGIATRVDIGKNKTIDINGGFTQWDDVKAVYKDYIEEIGNRKSRGFGSILYTDETGRNDFDTMKTARDVEKLYFYVSTIADITPQTDANWMTLFIYTGSESNIKWCGYDYVVNRVSPGGNEAIIEKYSENGTWNEVGRAKLKVEGNKMMLEVSREVLDIPDNNGKGVINVQFKWADNYQLDENNALDIFSFYKNGDVAPYGRLNYVFSEEPSTNKK